MDFNLTMSAALMGDFIWLPEQTGCYRILESGIILTGRRKGASDWGQDIYRYYAGLVMNGRCKPLSLGQHIHYTILILIMALLKKDVQLKNDTLKSNWLSYLLLPVAYVRLKYERLKIRINKIIKS
jgi:hypothetical protein